MTVDGPVLFTPAGMTLYRDTREDTASPKFRWQCDSEVVRTTDDQQSGIGPRPEIAESAEQLLILPLELGQGVVRAFAREVLAHALEIGRRQRRRPRRQQLAEPDRRP